MNELVNGESIREASYLKKRPLSQCAYIGQILFFGFILLFRTKTVNAGKMLCCDIIKSRDTDFKLNI